MKVAKTNAKKSLHPKRNDIYDMNIMFDLNSAVYLVSKEELSKMTPGNPEEKNGVRIVVESKMDQVDKKENNPATVIKLKVTDLETKFESKVTLNLYHSSQGVHLQGGRRVGKSTSCSLLATFLDEFFKETIKNKSKLIRKIKETLLQMDLRKKYQKKEATNKLKKNDKEKKLMFKCTKCHYQTIVQTELKRHTYKQYYKEALKMAVKSQSWGSLGTGVSSLWWWCLRDNPRQCSRPGSC